MNKDKQQKTEQWSKLMATMQTNAKEEQESSGTSKRSKRGQSIDDSVLTSASKPSWRESLRAKRQKLKERSLTIDHFYR